ncbi:PLAC8 protein, partial [Psilopogon haemacephalus]|nr:PLAC8 protein [Psilopogon haemacephalus]
VAMASQKVITTQPQFAVAPQVGQWQTGILDCFSDCGICLCGMFCCLCLGSQVAGDMEECCLCGNSVALRTLYRTKYRIPGSIVNDWFAVHCCSVCSLCQLKRDIKRRKEMGIF